MADQLIHPQKLHEELKAAGLPVEGVSCEGRIDYARPLTAAERLKAEQVLAAHDSAPSALEVKRLQAYSQGITLEDMLWALWEHVFGEAPQWGVNIPK